MPSPLCPVFGTCGGCAYQDLPYESELRIKEEKLHTVIDPHQICQVFWNLMLNAIHSMPSGGILHVSTNKKRMEKSFNNKIDRGVVELADWTAVPPGSGIFMDCIRKHEDEVRWLSFLQLDEFLFSPLKKDLKYVLKEYESYSGVVINWQNFGSSGHRTEPQKLQIEAYTRKMPENNPLNENTKSIVNPRRVEFCLGPHWFILTKGFYVDENKKRIRVSQFRKSLHYYTCFYSVAKLRINHYRIRSKEEFFRKMRRRYYARGQHDLVGNINHNWKMFDRNDVEDTVIQRFLPELKRRMSN